MWGRDAFYRPYGYDNGYIRNISLCTDPPSLPSDKKKGPFSDFSRGEAGGGFRTQAKGISAQFYPRAIYFGKILY